MSIWAISSLHLYDWLKISYISAVTLGTKWHQSQFTVKMASCLNDFFVNKVQAICRKLESSDFDPFSTLRGVFNKRVGRNTIATFEFLKVSPSLVRKVIRDLTNSNAECRDRLSNWIIKQSEHVLVMPITHLINSSFNASEYGSYTKWKAST